jgi:hypothetical protein
LNEGLDDMAFKAYSSKLSLLPRII